MRQQEGFTLIELMIVVVIIGILASIAIPQFARYQLRSKTSEASRNLGTIRTHEEAAYARWTSYAQATPAPRAMAALAGAAGALKALWVSSDGFRLIGFGVQGASYYSYSIPAAPQSPTGGLGTSCAFAEGTVDTVIDGADPTNPQIMPQVVRDGATPPANVITPMAAGNLDGDPILMCWVTGNETTQIVAEPADGGENVF